MKKILMITSVLVIISMTAIGQNYIGLSQAKIIKRFGEPDEKGINYFVYHDQEEDGNNIYYFNQNKKCTAFLLTRKACYYVNYQRILNKEFRQTSANAYRSKSKGSKYLAEVIQLPAEFQIRIQQLKYTPGTDLAYEN